MQRIPGIALPCRRRAWAGTCRCNINTRSPAELRRVNVRATPCVVLIADTTLPDAAHQAAALVRIAQPGLHVLVARPTQPTGSPSEANIDVELEAGHATGTAVAVNAAPPDAALVLLDGKQGWMKLHGLAPVLCVVGPTRGHALSGALATHHAVATARASALLGIPSLAVCLATSDHRVSAQPAVYVAARVVEQALAVLRRAGGYPQATNHPRAHFPFPTRGRWALGRELAWPDSQLARQAAAEASAQTHADCWALGEETSWLGPGAGGSPDTAAGMGLHPDEAQDLLRAAFAEGDMFLAVNVPPKWVGRDAAQPGQPLPFASTRAGVLWHVHQVAVAEGAPPAGAGTRLGASDRDVWGRSLPSQGFGSASPRAGAFVDQDNTEMVAGRFGAAGVAGVAQMPTGSMRFTVSRGTVLNDHAVCGDVEAVFQGRATVTCCQTWPPSHPFALRDALLVHALREGEHEGLPLWMVV